MSPDSQTLSLTVIESAQALEVRPRVLMKEILFAPASLFFLGISAGVSLVQLFTDPEVYNKLFAIEGLYHAWGVVRDIFNLLFIFALLFSAFATIFQIQKYHLKNILVRVLILALLINFSWLITRIIIDISHVLMFFFLGDQDGNGLLVLVGSLAQFEKVLLGTGGVASATYTNLFMIDIFSFIFMITIFNIAFQLIIRPAILMVLLILSPVGIAGAAIPQLQSASNKWWSALIQNAFRAPILIFMLIFAISIMSGMTNLTEGVNIDTSISENVQSAVAGNEADFGQSMVIAINQFLVPISILWTALAMSKVMGDTASTAALGMMRNFGRKTSSITLRGARGTVRGAGRLTKGAAKAIDNNTGSKGARLQGKFQGLKQMGANLSKNTNEKFAAAASGSEARGLEKIPKWAGGDTNALKKQESKDIQGATKKLVEDGISIEDAATELDKAKSDFDVKKFSSYISGHKDLSTAPDATNKTIAQNIGKFEGASANKISGSLATNGYAHDLYKGRLASGESVDDAFNSTYKSMDAKTFAKQKSTFAAVKSDTVIGNSLRAHLRKKKAIPEYDNEVTKNIADAETYYQYSKL